MDILENPVHLSIHTYGPIQRTKVFQKKQHVLLSMQLKRNSRGAEVMFNLFRKKKSSNQEEANSEVHYYEEDESLSVFDAAMIWASNGKDEDYTFGYSEEELEDALE